MGDWNLQERPNKPAFNAKAFFKTWITAGLAFGVPMAIMFGLIGGLSVGLTGGFVSGALFGLMIAGFTAVLSLKMAGSLPLRSGEELFKEGPASLFVNMESVGGWLTLTDQRLQFTPHKINVQTAPMELPLHQIASAATVATAGIVPNGLKIDTATGETFRFVVNGRAEWVDAMARAKRLRY